MWGRKPKAEEQAAPAPGESAPLKDAIRQARIESAEQSAVVVDLRDAELARLELLNEALDPLFAEIPPEVELFDRGISRGDTPRLWIDPVAHVVMGRDKRRYRLVQDTRYGRKILAESHDIGEMADAVKHYLAARLVERERALTEGSSALAGNLEHDMRIVWRKRRWRMIRAFLFGLAMGCLALFGALWLLALQLKP